MNDQQIAQQNSRKMHEKLKTECTIEDLAQALESAAPPIKKLKAADKVAALKKQILDAQKRGHTAESIHQIFEKAGEKISKRMIADLLAKPRAKSAPTEKESAGA